MPRDSNGVFSLVPGTLVSTGDTLEVSQHNPPFQDVATALTNSLDRNGTGGMRADLDMGGFAVSNMADGVVPTDGATVGQLSGLGVPIGMPFPWFTSTAPTGYILAYGQAISRTAFADLFAVFGTQFGVGDGSTTFNVPDCRGVAFVGKDDMGGTALGRLTAATTLGAVVGAQSVTLSTAEMPSHAHTGLTTINGAHSHTLNAFLGGPGGIPGAPVQGGTLGAGFPTTVDGDHQHGITAEGGGGAHANVQPSFVVNIIIKALN